MKVLRYEPRMGAGITEHCKQVRELAKTLCSLSFFPEEVYKNIYDSLTREEKFDYPVPDWRLDLDQNYLESVIHGRNILMKFKEEIKNEEEFQIQFDFYTPIVCTVTKDHITTVEEMVEQYEWYWKNKN